MAPLAKFVISNPSHKVMVRKVRAAARPSGARERGAFRAKAPRTHAWLLALSNAGCATAARTVTRQCAGKRAAVWSRASSRPQRPTALNFHPCARCYWGPPAALGTQRWRLACLVRCTRAFAPAFAARKYSSDAVARHLHPVAPRPLAASRADLQAAPGVCHRRLGLRHQQQDR